VLGTSRVASAQETPPPVATEDAKQKAQEHFAKAKELYQDGNYAAAKKELEAAHALDPTAKDLLYNLGIVCEKMQEYDDAITHFREYQKLEDLSAAEKEKAETILRRIEGAKKSAPPKKSDSPRIIVKTVEVPVDRTPSRGRVDGLTVAAAGLTVAAVVTGTVFGVMALGAQPANGTTTSAAYPHSQLQEDTDRAKTFALVSDVGFGVAIAGAVATAILFFARTKDAPKKAFAPLQVKF
jgi:tetratricopeptide (TPR) repeat protein